MSWSGSKPFDEKWYRIRGKEGGQKEILEANHQWAIEKGQGDDFSHAFNHYFQLDGSWFAQRNIAYRYLFADISERRDCGYPIERPAGHDLDELFAKLRPIEEWVVFLEERINDCELAIQYQLNSIEKLRASIKACRNARDGSGDQELRRCREGITECAQRIRRQQREHAELVARLRDEERMEWHGMQCCAEILHLTYEDLIAGFLDDER